MNDVTALPNGTIVIRNSRHPDGPAITCTREEWLAFLGGVKNGEFDLDDNGNWLNPA